VKPDPAFYFQKLDAPHPGRFFFRPPIFFWRNNSIEHFRVITTKRVLGEAAGVAVRRRRPFDF
jgi:hypothetical protein